MTGSTAIDQGDIRPQVDGDKASGVPAAKTTRLILILVVLSSFLGRYSVDVAGVSVRPEQVASLVLVGWMFVNRIRRQALVATIRNPMVLVLVAWLAVGLLSTALFAPQRATSIPVLAWLALDVALLASLLALSSTLQVAEKTGMAILLPWAAMGVLTVTAAVHGLAEWGVQFDTVFRVYAAYVTAYEANIFAAFVVVWSLILVWNLGQRVWVSLVAAMVVPLAIVAAQTRAALVALVVGLLVMLAMTWRRWWRTSTWWTHTRGPVLMLVGLAAITLVGPLRDMGRVPAVESSSGPIVSSPAPSVSASMSSSSNTPGNAPSASSSGGATVTPSGAGETGSTTPESTSVKITHFGLGDNFEFRRIVAQLAFSDMHGIRWIVGNGINTFGQRHDDPTQKGVPGYISSLPIQLLYDTGLVGVGLFLAFVVSLYRRVPRARLSLAVPVGVSVAITMSFTSTLWFSTTWIIAAILVRVFTPGTLGDPTTPLRRP